MYVESNLHACTRHQPISCFFSWGIGCNTHPSHASSLGAIAAPTVCWTLRETADLSSPNGWPTARSSTAGSPCMLGAAGAIALEILGKFGLIPAETDLA